MSRAFTTENDSWLYCINKREFCLYALGGERCARSICIYDQDRIDERSKESKKANMKKNELD